MSEKDLRQDGDIGGLEKLCLESSATKNLTYWQGLRFCSAFMILQSKKNNTYHNENKLINLS